jgi:hypothetical protein
MCKLFIVHMDGLRASDCESWWKSLRFLISVWEFFDTSIVVPELVFREACVTVLPLVFREAYVTVLPFICILCWASQSVYSLDYGLDLWGIVRIPVGARNFSSLPNRSVRPFPPPPPHHPAFSSVGTRNKGSGGWSWPLPSSLEVKCAWSSTPYACLNVLIFVTSYFSTFHYQGVAVDFRCVTLTLFCL